MSSVRVLETVWQTTTIAIASWNRHLARREHIQDGPHIVRACQAANTWCYARYKISTEWGGATSLNLRLSYNLQRPERTKTFFSFQKSSQISTQCRYFAGTFFVQSQLVETLFFATMKWNLVGCADLSRNTPLLAGLLVLGGNQLLKSVPQNLCKFLRKTKAEKVLTRNSCPFLVVFTMAQTSVAIISISSLMLMYVRLIWSLTQGTDMRIGIVVSWVE